MRRALATFALAGLSCAAPRAPEREVLVPAPLVRESGTRAASTPVTPAHVFHLALAWYEKLGDFNQHPGQLTVLGDRVVFVHGVPVAVAEGGGPMLASTTLAVGLPHQSWDTMMYGLAGGDRSAFALFGRMTTRIRPGDAVAYRLTPAGWTTIRGARPVGHPQAAQVLPWGDAGAVVVEEDDADSSRLGWLGDVPRKAPARLALAAYATATREKQLWAVGERPRAKGIWVARVDDTGATTFEPLPGLESCRADRGSVHGALVARGAHVLVMITDDSGACEPTASVLFAHDGTSWQRRGEEPKDAHLLAVDRRGTAWIEHGNAVVGRSPGGETTEIPLPDVGSHIPDTRCDTRMLIRGEDDRWLHRSCMVGREHQHLVYRENTKQELVVLRSEKSRMEVQ